MNRHVRFAFRMLLITGFMFLGIIGITQSKSVQLIPQVGASESLSDAVSLQSPLLQLAVCGNRTCDRGEDCSTCPEDCGTCPPVCGNRTCERGEDCRSCPADCGACTGTICGNRTCERGEDCNSCPDDCGACPRETCGNGFCGVGEDSRNCPQDCPRTTCGNSQCERGEDCATCPADCGRCVGPTPTRAPSGSTCGDSTCARDESCETCPRDCGFCEPLPEMPVKDGVCNVATNGNYEVNIRREPLINSDIVGTMRFSEMYTATAKSADGQWFHIGAGWVAGWVTRQDSDCQDLRTVSMNMRPEPTAEGTDDTGAAGPRTLVDGPVAPSEGQGSTGDAPPKSPAIRFVRFEDPLTALEQCGQSEDTMADLPQAAVQNILASPDPCVTFDRTQRVLRQPDLSERRRMLLLQAANSGVNPLVLTTSTSPFMADVQELCPSLFGSLGSKSIPELAHIFAEYNAASSGSAAEAACDAIASGNSQLTSSCITDPNGNPGAYDYVSPSHGNQPFMWFGTSVSQRDDCPWLVQSHSIETKLAVLGRPMPCSRNNLPLSCGSTDCGSVAPLAPNITGPSSDTSVSGRPAITWEYAGDCDPDEFQIHVVDIYGPLQEATVAGSARSWTPPQALQCNTTHSVAVFAKNAQGLTDSPHHTFFVGTTSCVAPPTEEPQQDQTPPSDQGQTTEDQPETPPEGQQPPPNQGTSETGLVQTSPFASQLYTQPQPGSSLRNALAGTAAVASTVKDVLDMFETDSGGGGDTPSDGQGQELGEPVVDDSFNPGGADSGTPSGSPGQASDSDGDGTYDDADACPGVAGTAENAGCPVVTLWDYDGDGIPDNEDGCPTQPGFANNNGCPVNTANDSDGDGFLDTVDMCPQTPGPESNNGCPLVGTEDRDGDGVPDAIDSCPDIPGNSAIGCPEAAYTDADGDGLSDGDDSCVDVPGPWTNNGCPVPSPDPDGDGVPSSLDYCPTIAGNNAAGCPSPTSTDSDGDGVPDDADACLEILGSSANSGCPVPNYSDQDGDGTPDGFDLCPTVAGNDSVGCPQTTSIDGDGDGVIDMYDICPNAPGSQNGGCPTQTTTDTDGDGVADFMDFCPTVTGSGDFGCPLPYPQDFDGDGIYDEQDACVDVPGLYIYDGCPEGSTTDTDGDGTLNVDDLCPVVPGPASNGGCPLVGQFDTDDDGVSNYEDICPQTPGSVYNGGCPLVMN